MSRVLVDTLELSLGLIDTTPATTYNRRRSSSTGGDAPPSELLTHEAAPQVVSGV